MFVDQAFFMCSSNAAIATSIVSTADPKYLSKLNLFMLKINGVELNTLVNTAQKVLLVLILQKETDLKSYIVIVR